MHTLRMWTIRALMAGALILVPLLHLTTSDATLPPVTNFAKVQVSTGYNSSATSIVLLSGHGAKLPSTFPFPLVWWNCTDFGAPEDDPFVEIVSDTAKTGDALTVVRAQEGTAASNHNTGGKTYCMILTLTKGMWDQIRADIAAAAGGASMVTSGTGSPEGVVSAEVGKLFLRTNGAIGSTLYTKESGTGNTGWAPVLTVTNWAAPGPIGATTPNSGAFTDLTMKRIIGTSFAPTYGTTVSIDASLGDEAVITATNGTGFNVSNPTNAVTGNWLSIEVKNTSGGVLGTITWDTLYKIASFTKPGNGFRRTVTFRYNGTHWVEKMCSPEVPN